MGYVEGLLGTNEHILRQTRRHWIVLAPKVIVHGGLALLLFVLAGLLYARGEPLGRLKNVPMALLAAIAVWFLALLLVAVLRWRSELYILTNRRIVQVEGVINKLTIDSSLDKINDVVLAQSALGRLLGYGDLEILTASEFGVNKLTMLAGAMAFKTAMLNAKEALRSGGEGQPTAPPAPVLDLTARLTELNELRQQGLITDEEYQAKRAEILSRV